MIQTTQAWKDYSVDHSNYHPLIVVIKDGNIIWTFDATNIKEGSLRFTDDVTDLGDFNIGATPSNSFECDIINFDNTFPSPDTFKGCRANLYFFLERPEFGGTNAVAGQAIVGQAIVGTESTWTDYIKRGVYYLDPVNSVGRTVHISGSDAMSLPEFNSANMTGFSFSGLTCYQAIKQMGFNLQHDFPNSDYVLPNVVCNEESNLANITKRTALGYIASLCGCYARHDNTGELRLEQFNPNVLVYPYYQTTRTASGITFTDNGDGTITANGTATADVYFYCARYSTDYGVGQYFLTGCPDGGSRSTYSMYMYVDGANSWDFGKGNYVTVKNPPASEAVVIKIGSGTTVNNMLFTPQLKKVSAYIGNYESIPIPYSLSDGTTNGITYTQDGHSATLNGTATATFNYRIAGWTIAQGAIKLDPDKKYYLCGTPDGSSTSTYILSCRCYAHGVTPGSNTGYIERDYGWGTYITGYEYISIYFTVFNGQTVENLEVKPRLYEVSIDKVMQEPILDYYPVEITGVFVSGTEGSYSVKGNDGYYMFVENNPLITSPSIADEIATNLLTAYNGLSVYPFSLSYIADPSLQAGDTIEITYNGSTTTTIVTSFQYALGNQSTLEMSADTEEHSSAEALIASIPGTKLAIQDLYKGDVLKKIINLSADEVQIDAQQMNINGVVSANGNFRVNTDGTIEAVNGKFSGTVNASSGTFSGSVNSSSGTIGGFSIESNNLHNGMASLNSTASGVYVGTDGIGLGGGKFKVTSIGELNTVMGKIGAWFINDYGLRGDIEYAGEQTSQTFSMTMYSNTTGSTLADFDYQYPIELITVNPSITPIPQTLFAVTLSGKVKCVSVQQSSDRRLKEHVKYLDENESAEFIYKLKPVEFKYLLGDKKTHRGFYAQEVQEISADDWSPVEEDEKGTLSLAYTEIIADLVATVQSLNKRIEELEKKHE